MIVCGLLLWVRDHHSYEIPSLLSLSTRR
jgi:hypothetical protein